MTTLRNYRTTLHRIRTYASHVAVQRKPSTKLQSLQPEQAPNDAKVRATDANAKQNAKEYADLKRNATPRNLKVGLGSGTGKASQQVLNNVPPSPTEDNPIKWHSDYLTGSRPDEDNAVIHTSDSTTGASHPQKMRNMIMMTPTPHHRRKQSNPELTKLQVGYRPRPY